MLLGLAAAILAAGACPAQEVGSTPAAVHHAFGSRDVPSAADEPGAIPIVPPSALKRGANSFTEGQARARLQDAGFAGISAMHRDDGGIWRGRAVRDGTPVGIGFDYKGDIAAE